MDTIRIVGLEEHIALPGLLDAWAQAGVPQIPQLGYRRRALRATAVGRRRPHQK